MHGAEPAGSSLLCSTALATLCCTQTADQHHAGWVSELHRALPEMPADAYSWGIIMWELVSWELPWSGENLWSVSPARG